MSDQTDTLQYRLWYALSPRAHRADGLSPLNRIIILLIGLATTVMVLETEPAIMQNPWAARGMLIANGIFALVFTAEFAVRFYIAGVHSEYQGVRGRLRWLFKPITLLDLAAFVPLYFYFFGFGMESVLLRFARIIRIIGLGRLSELTHAGRLLVQAIRARSFELVLIGFGILGTMLLFATLLYVAEGHIQPEAFGSIPRAMWWSVNTLTTVGYGDVVPITPLGKVLGGIAAFLAIGVIAAPAGILAAAFSDAFYEHRRHRENRTHNMGRK